MAKKTLEKKLKGYKLTIVINNNEPEGFSSLAFELLKKRYKNFLIYPGKEIYEGEDMQPANPGHLVYVKRRQSKSDISKITGLFKHMKKGYTQYMPY